MKRTIKNFVVLFIVLVLVLSALAPIFADTSEDFAANESMYANLCKGIVADDKKETCANYKQFLLDRAASNQERSSELSKDRAAIEQNITANFNKLAEYNAKIEGFNNEIKGFEDQITTTQYEIERLNGLIETRKAEIKKIEDEVRDYMVNSQSTMRVNGYIEFVMGSNNFSDIIRRIEGMNNIKRYNESLVSKLREERIKLEKDQALVQVELSSIEADKQLIEVKRSDIEVYKAEVVAFQEQLRIQKVNLETQDAAIQEQIQLDQDAANSIAGMVSSGGAILPLRSFQVTQRIGPYIYNTYHLGVDFAPIPGGSGAPIFAPGNGIVISASGGCYEGNTSCGGGYGNYVAMIFIVESGVYGALFGHMQPGGINVGVQQTVSAGQVIGYVGNTGISFGAHVHAEIFDLGFSSVSEAFNAWNSNSGGLRRDHQFGLGGSSGRGSSLCDNKGSTPCRLYSDQFYGV